MVSLFHEQCIPGIGAEGGKGSEPVPVHKDASIRDILRTVGSFGMDVGVESAILALHLCIKMLVAIAVKQLCGMENIG